MTDPEVPAPAPALADKLSAAPRKKPKRKSRAVTRRKGLKIGDFRRVFSAWDFQKDDDEQATSTIDLGEQVLLSRKEGHKWSFEAERARFVYIALQHCLHKILTRCGYRRFEYGFQEGIGRYLKAFGDKNGAPKSKIPDWLNIPYIIVKEGEDPMDRLLSGIKAERDEWRNRQVRIDSLQPDSPEHSHD
ncbi:hypothetical protein P280DRAFT_473438 [Massarina eburnea CBS 473.64]|uniref:Uncharacterized protein n=1 Tax=Massarina eburnea CBS 473.64 TaxID=1395130 RepID=A0A6A6RL76_9PLEO|nr:hypothetical protein P280DRAFT_473438 [Massarina eburnea CBS 473.64]